MTKVELLTALKVMTVGEQLKILEITSKIIRDSLTQRSPEQFISSFFLQNATQPDVLREQTDLEIAAKKVHSFYAEDRDLAAFIDGNSEDFYVYP